MIDIIEKDYKPSILEMSEYIDNQLFNELYVYMDEKYKAAYEIAYSGDKVLLGWNIRLYKSGKTLCRIYPRNGYFIALVVVGRKEKVKVEELLPVMSKEMNELYNKTKEGMGQRWLLFEFKEQNDTYNDFLKIIDVRRNSK